MECKIPEQTFKLKILKLEERREHSVTRIFPSTNLDWNSGTSRQETHFFLEVLCFLRREVGGGGGGDKIDILPRTNSQHPHQCFQSMPQKMSLSNFDENGTKQLL